MDALAPLGKYSVYMHEFPDSKLYIGITSQPVEKRWGEGGRGYLRRPSKTHRYTQPKMAKAIHKWKWENVKHYVLFEGLTKDEAEDWEKYLIGFFDTIENGYNKEPGGGTHVRGDDDARKV